MTVIGTGMVVVSTGTAMMVVVDPISVVALRLVFAKYNAAVAHVVMNTAVIV